MSELKPNFDRDGNEKRGLGYWVSFLAGLGGDGAKSVAFRWAVVALLAVGAKKYQQGGLPSYLK